MSNLPCDGDKNDDINAYPNALRVGIKKKDPLEARFGAFG
jgi:hypothetical protein